MSSEDAENREGRASRPAQVPRAFEGPKQPKDLTSEITRGWRATTPTTDAQHSTLGEPKPRSIEEVGATQSLKEAGERQERLRPKGTPGERFRNLTQSEKPKEQS